MYTTIQCFHNPQFNLFHLFWGLFGQFAYLSSQLFFPDFDLRAISNICVSISYISLRGCTSVSDVGISSLISKCLKLNSIVACDTSFGQQSVLALFSSNASYDHHLSVKHSGMNIPHGCNLQMLHIGGCKGGPT